MAVNLDVRDLGNLLGSGLSEANSYKQDFIDSEAVSDLNLNFTHSVELHTSLLVCRQLISSHFTLDHPVNGILDSPNLYLDTNLGGRNCPYIFIDGVLYGYFTENFNDTTYAVAGTANWDTTTARLRMSSLSTHLPKVTYYDIGTFTYDSATTLTEVTVNADETKWNPTDIIKYLVSFDSRVTWTEVTKGVTTSLSSGVTGYLRIVFQGNGNKDTYVDNVRVLVSVI